MTVAATVILILALAASVLAAYAAGYRRGKTAYDRETRRLLRRCFGITLRPPPRAT